MSVAIKMTEVAAYNHLSELEPSTIIDDNWFEYFFNDWQTLEALLVISGCRHYKEVVDKYEGWSVDELLNAYLTGTLKTE